MKPGTRVEFQLHGWEKGDRSKSNKEHTCIGVSAVEEVEDDDTRTDAEIRADHMETAGRLARLAATAEPWVRLARRDHGCEYGVKVYRGTADLNRGEPQWVIRDGTDGSHGSHCEIGTFGLLDPWPYGAAISVTVPVADVKIWKARVAHWWGEIQRADTRTVFVLPEDAHIESPTTNLP